MLIAGVLCVCAALAVAASGLWTLIRPRSDDPSHLAMRAMAPAQLGAAAMFAVGGAVALAGPRHGAGVVVLVCAVGAVGTLAAGSWQSARYIARHDTERQDTDRGKAAADCAGSCATCTLSCH